MDALEPESRLRAHFLARGHGVAAAYLFGSVARGTSGAKSDVDVAVLLVADPPRTLEGYRFDLQADLEAALGRTVDLVVLNRAPPELVHRVLRDGKLIVDLDPSRRIRFEVKARNEYFDSRPFLLRYRRLESRGR